VTFKASTSRQLLSPSGTKIFFPFPALYVAPNYGGKPDVEGNNPDDNAFAFQMGKRYDFRFDFDATGYPRIEFITGDIDDFITDTIDLVPPLLGFGADTFSIPAVTEGKELLGPRITTENRHGWKATCLSNWLQLVETKNSSVSGVTGQELMFTAENNSTGKDRFAKIIFTAGKTKDTLVIRQIPYSVKVDAENISLYCSAQSSTAATVVTTDSPTGWVADENVDWLEISNVYGNNGDAVRLNIAENNTSLPRAAVITVTVPNEISTSFIVTQPPLTFSIDSYNIEMDPDNRSGVSGCFIATNHPDGWKAEVIDGSDWLTLDTIAGKGGTSLKYSVDYTHADRTATIAVSVGTGVRNATYTVTQKEYIAISADGIIPFNLAFIPHGQFWTGTKANSGTLVTLTKDYYMAETEVTNEQYAAFLNDMHIGADAMLPDDGVVAGTVSQWALVYEDNQWKPVSGKEKFPVQTPTWYGDMAYCRWLSSKVDGYIFSLATEAEWQYAYQAGTEYLYNGQSDSPSSDLGTFGTLTDVGSAPKGKNPWSLQDMFGSLWETCYDWYSETYPYPTSTDPVGPETGDACVRRGDRYSWMHDGAANVRNSTAKTGMPSDEGFRVSAKKLF
jgi:hypothetical protein